MTSVDGVKPALQGRSKKRRDDLIQAGMELLKTNSVQGLSIIDLTAHCGYSVGTFYSRFEDKRSFFQAVQIAAIDLLLDRMKAGFVDRDWSGCTNEQIFRAYIDILMDTISEHTYGVVKESITYADTDKDFWLPMRHCGNEMAANLFSVIRPRFLDEDPKRSYDSVAFSLQMMYATIAYAAANHSLKPLGDPAFKEDLIRVLLKTSELNDLKIAC